MARRRRSVQRAAGPRLDGDPADTVPSREVPIRRDLAPSPSARTRRTLLVAGVWAPLAFVSLYVLAATLYPGGTKYDPAARGFSVVDSYFCDLLDAVARNGAPNPGRPFAIAAAAVLAAGLAALFVALAAELPVARARLVRVAGVASAAVMPLVATPHHDLAIDAGVLLGGVAFAVAAASLPARPRAPRVLAWAALSLVLTTFAIWQTHVAYRALPLVQKVAFAAFLAWMVVVARARA
jgi:hypothetical protein